MPKTGKPPLSTLVRVPFGTASCIVPPMPNWLYLLVNATYHLGLALWIGGTVALGALTAPALFRALPRAEAGAVFSQVLRRFARLRVVALLLVVAGATAKSLRWESHAASPWLLLRWLAIAVLAASLVYEIGIQERVMDGLRKGLTPEMGEEDPLRREFGKHHRRAERLMKGSLVAAAAALFFS